MAYYSRCMDLEKRSNPYDMEAHRAVFERAVRDHPNSQGESIYNSDYNEQILNSTDLWLDYMMFETPERSGTVYNRAKKSLKNPTEFVQRLVLFRNK